MAQPVTFQRLYAASTGPEHPAPPHVVTNVLRSMNEAANSDAPFKTLFRMDDGTTVLAKPRAG
jgi:hypothetical protein